MMTTDESAIRARAEAAVEFAKDWPEHYRKETAYARDVMAVLALGDLLREVSYVSKGPACRDAQALGVPGNWTIVGSAELRAVERERDEARAKLEETEPAPELTRPICDTPGCGRSIPVGGEGHPQICPHCLQQEHIDRLTRERDEARAKIPQWYDVAAYAGQVQKERDEAIRDRDALRAALETLRNGMRDCDALGMGESLPCEYEMPPSTNKRVRALIDAALAAVQAKEKT